MNKKNVKKNQNEERKGKETKIKMHGFDVEEAGDEEKQKQKNTSVNRFNQHEKHLTQCSSDDRGQDEQPLIF